MLLMSALLGPLALAAVPASGPAKAAEARVVTAIKSPGPRLQGAPDGASKALPKSEAHLARHEAPPARTVPR